MFRSRILPAIIAVWGALIVIRLLAIGASGDGAYGDGQYAAGVFGLVMVAAGVRALLKARES
jgi:peptidoglycan/LPS O-acetylase OafA/YrhL